MLASVERLAKPSRGYPGKCGIGALCVRSLEIQTLSLGITEVSHPCLSCPFPLQALQEAVRGDPHPSNARMVFHMYFVGGRGSESEWCDLKG